MIIIGLRLIDPAKDMVDKCPGIPGVRVSGIRVENRRQDVKFLGAPFGRKVTVLGGQQHDEIVAGLVIRCYLDGLLDTLPRLVPAVPGSVLANVALSIGK